MHGDGIVLGWHAGRLLESPAEDNVVLFGVQRSGKTSTVVVPTLLAWCGAAVATSTCVLTRVCVSVTVSTTRITLLRVSV